MYLAGNPHCDPDHDRYPPIMSLAELEKEVLKLSPGELSAFTRWLDDYTARSWDDQLERDVAAGKLDRFAVKADEDFETGRCTEL